MNSIVNESTTQRQGGEGGPTNPASPSDVVAALRRHEWVRIMQEAADLIEQQAERIKELEAERDGWREDANISRNSIAMLKDRCNHFEDTLAALRQRIDDAPVVGWRWVEADMSKKFAVYEFGIPYSYKHVAKPLISKEDLE